MTKSFLMMPGHPPSQGEASDIPNVRTPQMAPTSPAWRWESFGSTLQVEGQQAVKQSAAG